MCETDWGMARRLDSQTASMLASDRDNVVSEQLFGPLLGLVFHRHAGIGGLLLLSAATFVHWVLVSLCLVRNGSRFDPDLWRDLFSSLQLSGPLLLCIWLLAAGP
jgi:hypothetical protein